MAENRRWISNDGRAELEASGPHLRCRVPLDPTDPACEDVRDLLLYPRATPHGDVWIGKAWGGLAGNDLDVVVVVRDGDELLAARTITRPHAAGGEKDPRGIEADYRCARVIEQPAREPAGIAELRRLAGLGASQ